MCMIGRLTVWVQVWLGEWQSIWKKKIACGATEPRFPIFTLQPPDARFLKKSACGTRMQGFWKIFACGASAARAPIFSLRCQDAWVVAKTCLRRTNAPSCQKISPAAPKELVSQFQSVALRCEWFSIYGLRRIGARDSKKFSPAAPAGPLLQSSACSAYMHVFLKEPVAAMNRNRKKKKSPAAPKKLVSWFHSAASGCERFLKIACGALPKLEHKVELQNIMFSAKNTQNQQQKPSSQNGRIDFIFDDFHFEFYFDFLKKRVGWCRDPPAAWVNRFHFGPNTASCPGGPSNFGIPTSN